LCSPGSAKSRIATLSITHGASLRRHLPLAAVRVLVAPVEHGVDHPLGRLGIRRRTVSPVSWPLRARQLHVGVSVVRREVVLASQSSEP
jgi:hypothetical protein